MLISKEELDQFNRIRRRFANALKTTRYISNDRAYPLMGSFEVTVVFPSYYDDPAGMGPPLEWDIDLLCYIDSTQERAIWCGRTFRDALDKCESDTSRLIKMMKSENPREARE